ncbi:GNAT family N-acetyltransferase [Bifidobacterium sp. 64T4]|uniref:GNAT family N-acetyltransferase n=1 Tax=Bifidobacterium pongonis TaxID=2834432 RepID=UPI001C57A87C|nr:GNAT family N-acetyltransferase [Bifidobacterium pongonis]MBW3095100.1 GNAT family N-acetyltransferase [Bifidobacterium pongonis]
MLIRHATMADLPAIAAVEATCFPAAEAASADALRDRLAVYPDCFWLLVDDEADATALAVAAAGTAHGAVDGGKRANASAAVHDGRLVAFINGFATDSPDLTDDMYDDAKLHNPGGAWQMIFGVDTAPAYQHHGYASMLMRHVIDDARVSGCSGLVLTCKDRLIGFYARFGYVDEGVSESTHGDVVWHQMRLRF